MKKVKFVLPVVAVMFAVAGVFATGNSVSPATSVDVVAPGGTCVRDGSCSNTGSPACQLPSATFTFIEKNGLTCSGNATGTFNL
jgi:hypothetical protein